MPHARMATRGMVSAPHHLAAQSGLAVLREGGNAIEAAVAAAATAAVVCPHMCGLGGDAFWLIAEPGRPAVSIDGTGAAAAAADAAFLSARGHAEVPEHGPLAALTVAGVVSSWQAALETSGRWGGQLPLTRLLADAIHYARGGFAATSAQVRADERLGDALAAMPGYADAFRADGRAPKAGALVTLPRLADTLERLAARGLDDFYRGGLGHYIGAELQKLGSPLVSEDMARHRSIRRRPLSLSLPCGTLYGTPPPTQGLAALMIPGLFQRLGVAKAETFDFVHGLVEAARQADIVRHTHVTDPAYMTVHATTYLADGMLDRLAAEIDRSKAQPWPAGGDPDDSAWIGIVDAHGRAVSLSQSLFTAFGSGVMLADTGILWHNRGAAFGLDPQAPNFLKPRRKPFLALNPVLATLKDGRLMACGAMEGEGQPQIQAAALTRYVLFDQDLQQAVAAPRWTVGRSGTGFELRLESRFDPSVAGALRAAGHAVTLVGLSDPLTGSVGAVVRHASGLIEGVVDPRGEGAVAAF